MKASRSRPNLSGLVPEQRLALYGAAAGAALAAASSAHANIISLDLTGLPTADRTTFYTANTGIPSLYFDVNAPNAAAAVAHNTFAGADFDLVNRELFLPQYNAFSRSAFIQGINPANGIEIFPGGGNRVLPFTTSNFVQQGGTFLNRAFIAGSYKAFNAGLPPGTTTYLGLKFLIGTDNHFGWVNLTVNPGFTVTLNALGYESEVDAPAHVEPPGGQTSVPDRGNSLVLLAMGAAGLIAFRVRQAKAA